MPHDTSLIEILSLMAVAVTAATLFSRLGLGAILGYLVGGALIGPWGLGLVEDPASIAHLGEFGVVFLLFLIGVELKPSRLFVMRRYVFGFGSLQLVVTGAALSALASWGFGIATGPAVIVGFGLALSSTAFGVQLLAFKGQLASHWGRASFSVLLFQDLAVVPLLALVSTLADPEFTVSASLGMAFLETMAILVGIIIAGRMMMNRVLGLVAASGTPEVFTGLALLLVLGFGWLMESAGLSMAMGAFIAGVLMADSEYKHQVELDIQPFRGLLLGLFFISVGMGINLGALMDHPLMILSLLGILLAVKVTVIVAIMRLGGLTLADAVKSGFLLAQAGEFGFVLFSYAVAEGVMPGALSETLMAVIALSMAITPLLVMLADYLAPRAARIDDKPASAPVIEEDEEQERVLIAGFGRVGETIAFILKDLDIPCAAIDMDPENVERARRLGFPAYYGDASRVELLHAVGAKDSALLVITMGDPKAIERTLVAARKAFPDIEVHTRAHDIQTANLLRKLGAHHAVPETLEASLQMAADIARTVGADPYAISTLLDDLRTNEYRALMTEIGLPPAAK